MDLYVKPVMARQVSVGFKPYHLPLAFGQAFKNGISERLPTRFDAVMMAARMFGWLYAILVEWEVSIVSEPCSSENP